MFGYITVNKEELKIREWKEYRTYYCGLCRALKRETGNCARLTLTYDMTFLILVLTGLYEPESKCYQQRCMIRLGQKTEICENACSHYAADMNLLLSYYNLLDDWVDERRTGKLIFAKLLEKPCQQVAQKYPRQNQAVLLYLERLKQCEKRKERNPDLPAGYTGELLGEIFVWKQDEWRESLFQMGYHMGKFIYLMDAYEDLEKDKKLGNYNPFFLYFTERGIKEEEREQTCYQILRMIVAEAAREFERLPILKNSEIIRNILYSGVWMNYERIRQQRMKGITET